MEQRPMAFKPVMMHSYRYFFYPNGSVFYDIIDLRTGSVYKSSSPVDLTLIAKIIGEHVMGRYVHEARERYTNYGSGTIIIQGNYEFTGEMLYGSNGLIPWFEEMFGKHLNMDCGAEMRGHGFKITFEKQSVAHERWTLRWHIDTRYCEIKEQSVASRYKTHEEMIDERKQIKSGSIVTIDDSNPVEKSDESEVVKVTIKKITVNTNLIQ